MKTMVNVGLYSITLFDEIRDNKFTQFGVRTSEVILDK